MRLITRDRRCRMSRLDDARPRTKILMEKNFKRKKCPNLDHERGSILNKFLRSASIFLAKIKIKLLDGRVLGGPPAPP